ncbi:hypothetical protein [Umezawaea beigongshangensis]|uniref:hypothetical protein n=1 Tax=Umezawaea beigongshangensis TaxID=2780383 RepID=UPI0018F176F9|nr:hypothetical protein [Umezawaea beigongshangensis]
MRIPNPDGTKRPCPTCGQPTVLAEIRPAQGQRVHCGTFRAECHVQQGRRAAA